MYVKVWASDLAKVSSSLVLNKSSGLGPLPSSGEAFSGQFKGWAQANWTHAHPY